jgi:hypothetical protein
LDGSAIDAPPVTPVRLTHYGRTPTNAAHDSSRATFEIRLAIIIMLPAYHRNIPGFDGFWNGGFPSQHYDYIYGNGSPDVRKLFGLRGYPAAGLPQTPSNP